MARLGYGRFQVYAILAGKVVRPPDFEAFVRPVVAVCTHGDARELASWRQRHRELEDAYAAAPGPGHRPEAANDPAVGLAALPPAPAGFAGRDAELQQLATLLGDGRPGPVTAVISGMAGVGKSSLALVWAHGTAGTFPDGRLFVDVRGFESDPAAPGPGVVRRLLDALGVGGDAAPPDLGGQIDLLRATAARRRVLFVLDDVRTAEQVRPLLPVGPGCAAVIISRHQLTGSAVREGATVLALEPLDVRQSRALLRSRLGDRATADECVVEEVVERCAGLPLSLAIVAARTAARPSSTLAAATADLRGTTSTLDALADDDGAIDPRTVLSWSYSALPPELRALFRRLCILPAAGISVDAAAALVSTSAAVTGPRLARLSRANLIMAMEPDGTAQPPRYRMHTLLRQYAGERVVAEETRRDVEAAERRALDHYLLTAFAAARVLESEADPIEVATTGTGTVVAGFADGAAATAWFAAEHALLLQLVDQAAASSPRHAWQLAWCLQDFLTREARWLELYGCMQTAAAAAATMGDDSASARMTSRPSGAAARLGRLDEARIHLGAAIEQYERLGDPVGTAHMSMHLSWVAQLAGQRPEASARARQARDLYGFAGHQRGRTIALNELGWTSALQGDLDTARRSCEEALILLDGSADLSALAATHDSLGYIHRRLQSFRAAGHHYRRAIELYEVLGDKPERAVSRVGLGDTHRDAGEPARAIPVYQAALAELEAIGRPAAEQVRASLRASAD